MAYVFGDMCVLQRISYSLLVAFCYRDLPPPDRAGLACPITEPASASGGRAARQVPASRQGRSYRGGSPPWRDRPGRSTPVGLTRLTNPIGLFPTRGKAAAWSFSSPTADRDRYPYGELGP